MQFALGRLKLAATTTTTRTKASAAASSQRRLTRNNAAPAYPDLLADGVGSVFALLLRPLLLAPIDFNSTEAPKTIFAHQTLARITNATGDDRSRLFVVTTLPLPAGGRFEPRIYTTRSDALLNYKLISRLRRHPARLHPHTSVSK